MLISIDNILLFKTKYVESNVKSNPEDMVTNDLDYTVLSEINNSLLI